MSSSDNNYNGIDAGDIDAQNLDSGLLPSPVPGSGPIALFILSLLILSMAFFSFKRQS